MNNIDLLARDPFPKYASAHMNSNVFIVRSRTHACDHQSHSVAVTAAADEHQQPQINRARDNEPVWGFERETHQIIMNRPALEPAHDPSRCVIIIIQE